MAGSCVMFSMFNLATSNARHALKNFAAGCRKWVVLQPSSRRRDQKPRLAKIAAIRDMIQYFAAGAEFREICDCRDRREKFTALTVYIDLHCTCIN